MENDISAYGLWSLVIVNSAVFLMFAFSFFKPQTTRDWRAFGAFGAFIVAFFAEMYGFPLSIYILSDWLQTTDPDLDLLSHSPDHLWSSIFGVSGFLHFSIIPVFSYLVIGAGFFLLSSAWHVLYFAQREHQLATTGPYAKIRHPQYMAFIIIMSGFLLQWPTILTLLMHPVFLVMYRRLALAEENEMLFHFGPAYMEYARKTPRFIPAWKNMVR